MFVKYVVNTWKEQFHTGQVFVGKQPHWSNSNFISCFLLVVTVDPEVCGGSNKSTLVSMSVSSPSLINGVAVVGFSLSSEDFSWETAPSLAVSSFLKRWPKK